MNSQTLIVEKIGSLYAVVVPPAKSTGHGDYFSGYTSSILMSKYYKTEKAAQKKLVEILKMQGLI
jgi:hypothetical protein